jgi:KaiC/GvpD/RAD55 family RecA-like ATPase
VEDQYLPGDIEGEGGEKLSDQLAEHRLIGILLRNPEIAAEIRSLVSPQEFFDRALGRAFDGIVAAEGLLRNEDVIDWLGGSAVTFGDRTAKQFVGHLIGESMDLTPADASVYANSIFECAERRFTQAGDTNLVGADAWQSKMGLSTWGDRNSAVTDEYDELVEGIIPERELVIMIGPTQAGKSFLGRHLCYCLARGVDFMGHRILKPVPVVWCAYEGGRGIKARDQAYEKATGFVGDMLLANLAEPIDLWSKELNVEELIKEIEGIKRTEFGGRDPAAIFIDTHNAATPGASEIDSADVSKIRDRYKRIASVFKCTVIIIGHTNSLGKMRGNEQLPNNAETVIIVNKKTRTENRQIIQVKDNDARDVRHVELWKQREGQTGPLFDFVLPAYETGLKNKFGKYRTSCVVTPPNFESEPEKVEEKKTVTTKAGFKLTDIEDQFFGVLWKQLMEAGADAPPELNLPKGTRVVHRSVVGKAYRESSIPEDGAQPVNSNTVKARWDRSSRRLRKFDVIGFQEPYFWWTGKPILGRPATQPQRSMSFDRDEAPTTAEFDGFPE